MRIISGKKRGIKLDSLKNSKVRPTLDRIKENLFNILESKVDFNDYNICFLDLFGGFGGVGIEAYSRGVNNVYINEKDKRNYNLILKNISKSGFEEKIKTLNLPYERAIKKLSLDEVLVDIIYLDPPYFFNISKYFKILEEILEKEILKDNGIIVIESEIEIKEEIIKKLNQSNNKANEKNKIEKSKKEKNLKNKLKIIDVRKYGRVSLVFIQKEGK